jgi:glutathionylspermidine synthase
MYVCMYVYVYRLADMKTRGSLAPTVGQFNELEAGLAEMWRITRSDTRVTTGNDTMYFACLNHHNEDEKNMEAMRRHANDAGFVTKSIHMEDIIWNGTRFVDRAGDNIDHCWKV